MLKIHIITTTNSFHNWLELFSYPNLVFSQTPVLPEHYILQIFAQSNT